MEEIKKGRPLSYTDPQKLKADIEHYFKTSERPTLAGLAYEIGISRQTLYNYEKKEPFFDIIKRAREKVESLYEERLLYSTQPTGVIFALKNMNWRDRQETDVTSGGKPVPILGNGILTDNSNQKTK